jgi:hypothetical protein
VPHRWLDNLLAHHHVPGVAGLRQGVARHLSPESVAVLHVTHLLTETLGCPAATAINLADRLAKAGSMELAPGLTIFLDLNLIQQMLSQQLLDAVVTAPPKRRGRPPGRKKEAHA